MDAGRIQSEFQRAEATIVQEPELKSNQQLAEEFGVSSSTIDRVRTILDQGTLEQIQSLRNKNETGEGPGVRTVYEQVQSEKLKSKLQSDSPR